MHLIHSLQYRLFQHFVALIAMMGLFFVSASPCWLSTQTQEERVQEIVWQELGRQRVHSALRPADDRRSSHRQRYRTSVLRKSAQKTHGRAVVIFTERDRMNGLGTYLLT